LGPGFDHRFVYESTLSIDFISNAFMRADLELGPNASQTVSANYRFSLK
jgi:hypothetical protein